MPDRTTLSRVARELISTGSITGLVPLLTCFRSEVYVAIPPGLEEEEVTPALARGLPGGFLTSASLISGEQVIRHLLRVSAGIDSVILGEAEILGQVRRALEEAEEGGHAGPDLSATFRHAVAFGRRARRETTIAVGKVSLVSTGLAMARENYGGIRSPVLVIGAGHLTRQILKYLRVAGRTDVSLVNRTASRARLLAEEFGHRALPWDRLHQGIRAAGTVLIAVSAPAPFLGPEAFSVTPQPTVIDFCVPPGLTAEARTALGENSLDLSAIHAEVKHNLAARQMEVPAVEDLIDQELAGFSARGVVTLREGRISELWDHFDVIRAAELERALRYLPVGDAENTRVLTKLSHGLMRKVLHPITRQIRNGELDEAEIERLLAILLERDDVPPSQD